MRKFLIIFGALIGVGMYFGLDGYSVWSGLLILILVFAGFVYMFTRRFVPQFLESFLIILFVPLFVLYLIQIGESLVSQFLGTSSPRASTGWILVILVVLMVIGYVYVRRARIGGRQPDRFQIQGAEREPVIPQAPYEHREVLQDQHDDEEEI